MSTGKNNIVEGNCFSKFLIETNEDGVATKPTDEREFGFVMQHSRA